MNCKCSECLNDFQVQAVDVECFTRKNIAEHYALSRSFVLNLFIGTGLGDIDTAPWLCQYPQMLCRKPADPITHSSCIYEFIYFNASHLIRQHRDLL